MCKHLFRTNACVWPWWRMFTERLDFLKVHRFSIDIKLSRRSRPQCSVRQSEDAAPPPRPNLHIVYKLHSFNSPTKPQSLSNGLIALSHDA